MGLLSNFYFLSAFCAFSWHFLKDPYTSAILVLHILEYGKCFVRVSKNVDGQKKCKELRTNE